MTMSKYKEDIKQANQELQEEIQRLEKLVCEKYQPIFDRVIDRVQKLMQSQGILRIKLSPARPYPGLYFSREKKFEIGTQGMGLELISVARAYQIEHRRERNTLGIGVQDALKIALDDLVKRSKEAYLNKF